MFEQAAASGVPTRGGLLRVATNSELNAAEEQAAATRESNAQAALKLGEQATTDLASYVTRQFEAMRRHRQSGTGWNDRLTDAMRMFSGEYDPETLAEIRKFGGSEIYARLVAVKCRGATALMRDIYLGPERSWGLKPTPDPTLPDDIKTAIDGLIETEVATASIGGEAITEEAITARRVMLLKAARDAAIRRAAEESKQAQRKLDDLLTEGGFYTALAEFLVDLPLFPFAVLKGPEVRIVPRVKWVNRKAVVENVPRMFWKRVSPFDFWFTPGVGDIAQAETAERIRSVRSDLNALLDLPGYDSVAIRKVLDDYGVTGYVLTHDTIDSQRADSERRENPAMNESGIIEGIEFHGSIQGKLLKEWGVKNVRDEMKDYMATVIMYGRHVIKAVLSPSPRKRHPYFITSFEKVPGTVVGNALPDSLSDIQDVCNATLRAMVNNLSLASGPQVVVDDDCVEPGVDSDYLYPWKRWHVNRPPGSNIADPVKFSQPAMHAQELLGIYEKFTQIADEVSAIPRYITGSERMGGAGRTASGLAMLMGNASKILQTVAANIDRDVFEPLLQMLYDIVMLTAPNDGEPGALRGDESIEVRGVTVAIQRETERQRQQEFLNNTNNPVDLTIMGPRGRAKVLRAVSSGLGMDGDDIVPSDDELQAREKEQQAQAMAMQMQQMGAPGGATPGAPGSPAQPGMPGASSQEAPQPAQPPAASMIPGQQPKPRAIQGPRVNLSGEAPAGGM